MPISRNLPDAEQELLERIVEHKPPTPIYRLAYSDRTAYLLAWLSELVYEPFGNLDADATKVFLQNNMSRFLSAPDRQTLNTLISAIRENDFDAAITAHLIADLKKHKMQILQTYDYKDTQALLILMGDNIALVFRGTEATSFRDIKTDLKAVKVKCRTGGGIHSGFNEAFNHVAAKIQYDLDHMKEARRPLLIAGHSLGGALAIVAAKRLKHEPGIAACYTFGSPRVGDVEWSYDIKPPIYRVVNAVDCVTMVPPGEIVTFFRWMSKYVPVAGRFIRWILGHFEGYYHTGDQRYLTNCQSDKYDDVQLLNSVTIFRRIHIFFRAKTFGPIPVTKFVKDHSISVYRKKLAVIADRKNKNM